MVRKSFCKGMSKVLGNTRNISLVFLGVGLTLFFLNLATFMSFLPEKYSFAFFDISVFSSMLIIIYSTYNLHSN